MNEKVPGVERHDLLPCPFCGGEPRREHYPAHKHFIAPMPDYPGAWSVECDACEFQLFDHGSQEAAAAAWNRRALRQGGGWQPIETCPRGDVFLYFPAEQGRNAKQEWMRVGFKGDCPRKPTHWQPLPAPPATAGKDEQCAS